MEVRVLGRPKPEGKWLKQGVEITPSEEYQIENFENGTSILIINDIYPDDSGEIVFEAHNALGVAVTTTELFVEGIIIFEKWFMIIFVFNFRCVTLMRIFLTDILLFFSNNELLDFSDSIKAKQEILPFLQFFTLYNILHIPILKITAIQILFILILRNNYPIHNLIQDFFFLS